MLSSARTCLLDFKQWDEVKVDRPAAQCRQGVLAVPVVKLPDEFVYSARMTVPLATRA